MGVLPFEITDDPLGDVANSPKNAFIAPCCYRGVGDTVLYNEV